MNVEYIFNNKLYEKKFYVDYFFVKLKKFGGKDCMLGGIGENNILLFSNLKKEIIKNFNDKGINLINIEFNYYFDISYFDIEFNENYVYFVDFECIVKDIYENYLVGIDIYYIILFYSLNIDDIILRIL